MNRLAVRAAPGLLLLLYLLAAAGPLPGAPAPGTDPGEWLASLRARAGLPGLAAEPLLFATARDYAEELARRGAISHRGADGSDALARYFRHGGTCARVGEILGAGPGLREIEGAWLQSPPHREAIMSGYWTGVGWGEAVSGGSAVWVVLFLQRRVEGLAVRALAEGTRVEGRFLPEEAAEPVLLSGTARVKPEAWEPGSRRFSFLLDPGLASGYVRLGYVTAGGTLVVTDVLTSPRGRESPGG
jgi:hypothetical protein